MEAILGQLVVRLKGDASHLNKTMKGNSERMRGWADGIKAATKVAAASLAGVAAGMSLAVRGMIKEADKMGQAAQSLAVPIESLTALKYAAEQTGIPFETLSGSLTKFNQSLGQIASGQINPAATALKALGISATTSTGALKSNTELLSEVADHFSRFKDGANKASLATALFGEQGIKLLPMLNQGSRGIKDLTDEAERLGVVISSEAARSAAEFNQALQRIGAAGRGTAMALAERLLPDLSLLADAIAKAAEQSKAFMIVLDSLAIAMKGIATLFVVAAGNITALLGGLQVLYTFARDFVNLGWDQAIASSTEKINELKKSLSGIGELISGMWGLGEDNSDRFNFAGRLIEMGVEIPQALAPAMQSVQDLSGELNALRDASRDALSELLNSPTETVEAKLAAITQAARDGVIGFNEYGAAVRRVSEENQAQLDNLVSASTGALNSLFSENKSVGIATALINTYQAITRALSSAPPPISYALAAATAAQGFAQVRAIRATKREFGGPVQAGQPYIVGEKRPELFVPSQSGTIIPSVPSAGGRNAPSGSMTMTVQGFDPKKLFSGETMRDIAEQMLSYQRNGGRIVFA